MKSILTNLALGILISSLLTACSFLPSSSEPELGAVRASSSKSTGKETNMTVNGVLFDFEEATLRPGANKIVLRAVDYLRTNPDSRVVVAGHTDHHGSKSFNQKLSEQRAGAIVNALKANGISANRITSTGYGETRPVADNKSLEGRRANRRVEIILRN